MPEPEYEIRPLATTWHKDNMASFKSTMTERFREMLKMIDSEFFPDWALEEISVKLAENTLTLMDVVAIFSEAYEDMIDLKALSEESPDQEVYTLSEVKRELDYL